MEEYYHEKYLYLINYFVNELITADDLKKRIHISYFDSEEKE